MNNPSLDVVSCHSCQTSIGLLFGESRRFLPSINFHKGWRKRRDNGPINNCKIGEHNVTVLLHGEEDGAP